MSIAAGKLVNNRYPATEITQNCRELIEDPSIDAVAIATPASTHYELALRALQEGKHVLVEKPQASNTDQVQLLIDLAQKLSSYKHFRPPYLVKENVKIKLASSRGLSGSHERVCDSHRKV